MFAKARFLLISGPFAPLVVGLFLFLHTLPVAGAQV